MEDAKEKRKIYLMPRFGYARNTKTVRHYFSFSIKSNEIQGWDFLGTNYACHLFFD